MNLLEVPIGVEQTVDAVSTSDEGLKAFLFTLGCYSGEPVTVVLRRRSGCIISVKGARYSIDANLARSITVR